MTLRYPLFTLALALAFHPAAHADNWRVLQDGEQLYDLNATVQALDDKDLPVDAWAIDPQGEWMVVGGQAVFHSKGFSQDVVTAAKLNLAFGRDILAADCSEVGVCLLVHSQGWFADGSLPPGLEDELAASYRQPWRVRDVEITEKGWTLLGTHDIVSWSQIPHYLRRALEDAEFGARTVQDVAIDFEQDWAVVADQRPMVGGAEPALTWRLQENAADGAEIDKMITGKGVDWIVYNGDDNQVAADLTDPWDAIEYDLGSDGDTIWQRMEDLGAVGVSVAIVEDNRVIGTRGYGVRHASFPEQYVYGSTPFDLASLTKYLSALTTMAVLESDDGLSLDTDIQDPAVLLPGGHVDTWIDRGNDEPTKWFWPASTPDLPDDTTYRRLLSHTASFRSGFPAPLPFNQVNVDPPAYDLLTGFACLPNACGFDGDLRSWVDPNLGAPGTQYNYSGHGYMALQASLEDRTGLTGGQIMHQYLFAPMGLHDINAYLPMGDFQDDIAWPHDNGQPQFLDEYPSTFSGGVYASAKDYAELMILALDEGRDSHGAQRLAPSSITPLMETQFTPVDAFSHRYGLGLFLGGIAVGEDTVMGFRHSGAHPDGSRSRMCGVPSQDVGIVVLTNSDSNMNTLTRDIVRAFTEAYGLAYGCGT